MAASDFHDRFVTLRDGCIVPAAAFLLALELEARHFTVSRDGDTTLIVRPPDRLTPADCDAIRKWKWHLLTLVAHCERADGDAHLFRDDAPVESPDHA